MGVCAAHHFQDGPCAMAGLYQKSRTLAMFYTFVAVCITVLGFGGVTRAAARKTLIHDSRIMTEDKSPMPRSLEAPASDQLLDSILEKATTAAQQTVEQFARLASLARDIEACNSSPASCATLLAAFEEIAASAEANAKLDVEFFQSLRNGLILKHELRRAHHEDAEPSSEMTILAPSTLTKH
ncbi:MAG: hypothetical protein AB1704_30430 [Pseudomonadota bacterium]|jgi:hypothetical protein|uniref:hypothetical protein n=2 Tax=Burkholderiales TaxID=80840 RepID=UPI0010F72895|nr:hypothetical protein [Burkholderia sp. 4M9327F10]